MAGEEGALRSRVERTVEGVSPARCVPSSTAPTGRLKVLLVSRRAMRTVLCSSSAAAFDLALVWKVRLRE